MTTDRHAGAHAPTRRSSGAAVIAALIVTLLPTSLAGTAAADDGLLHATQVSTGAAQACALLPDQTVACWGEGQAARLPDVEASRPAYDPEVGYQWAWPFTPRRIAGISGATSIEVGPDFACAVLTDATVRCWGSNQFGQLGGGLAMESADAVSAPVEVVGLTGVRKVAAGPQHACALVVGGRVACWGEGEYGTLGDGARRTSSTPVWVKRISGARDIASGNGFSCAIVAGGKVKCWGYGQYGSLGDGTPFRPGVRQYWRAVPVSVRGLTSAKRLSAASFNVCAVVTGGAVSCWGDLAFRSEFMAPADTPLPRVVPWRFKALGKVSSIEVGWRHSCAVTTSGEVSCWGSNLWGALSATYIPRSPLKVRPMPGFGTVTSVNAGTDNTCAIGTDSVVVCMGHKYPWPADSTGTAYPGYIKLRSVE